MQEGSLADVVGEPLNAELKEMISSIPDAILNCISKVNSKGGMWLVGGAVREVLLGRHPKDWDFAVDLSPDEMIELFPDAIPTGVAFGTVTLRAGDDLIETTTLRGEGTYGDGRRPDSVEYSKSLVLDLSRRDFTFNAMAVDVARGLLHDPFDGQIDLQNRCLRAVGDARLRLGEDGLRVIRAYRFMDLGKGNLCSADLQLGKSLLDQQHMLRMVAPERIWIELSKILAGYNAGVILHRMAVDGLLNRILPSEWDENDTAIIAQMSSHLQGISIEARLALLLTNAAAGGLEKELKKCKLSTSQIRRVLNLRRWVKSLPIEEPEGKLRVYSHLLASDLGEVKRMDLAWADAGGEGPSLTECIAFHKRLSELSVSRTNGDSLASGEWIMQHTKLSPGPQLGALKNWLHLIQIERNLGLLDEVEEVLCSLPWQHGDWKQWPNLSQYF